MGEALIALKNSSGWWRRCSKEEREPKSERVGGVFVRQTQHIWANLAEFCISLIPWRRSVVVCLETSQGFSLHMPELIRPEIHAVSVWILVNDSIQMLRTVAQWSDLITSWIIHPVKKRVNNITRNRFFRHRWSDWLRLDLDLSADYACHKSVWQTHGSRVLSIIILSMKVKTI